NIAAGSFTGSGAGLTNLSLPNTLVYNNQSNTFMAGFKQTFTANANYAGLNVAGLGSNPNISNLAAGDLWFRSDLHHLQAFDGTLVRQLMYSTDTISGSQVTGNISGNAASITGNIPESQVTNLTADLATQTTNLTNEIGARQAADSTLQSNINAEGVARMTADATLQGNIGAETTRAMGAEGTLTTNLNTEVTRAQAAEATKADLVKPVQVNNSALMGGSCTTATADAIVLNRTAPVGQQLLIC